MIPLGLYYAGLAGLGMAGSAANSPLGQRTIQSGISTLNKVGDKIQPFLRGLQNYSGFSTNLAPQGNIMSKINPGRVLSAAIPAFSMQYLTDPEVMKQEAADTYDLAKSVTDSGVDSVTSLSEEIMKMFKKEDKGIMHKIDIEFVGNKNKNKNKKGNKKGN